MGNGSVVAGSVFVVLLIGWGYVCFSPVVRYGASVQRSVKEVSQDAEERVGQSFQDSDIDLIWSSCFVGVKVLETLIWGMSSCGLGPRSPVLRFMYSTLTRNSTLKIEV